MDWLYTTWYGITLICVVSLVLLLLLSALFYKQFFKRFYDILLSGMAIVILSPILLVLIFFGTIIMKGNPFFIQERLGKNEKIFKLIKFRSMTCAKDKNGHLLPDDQRLVKYGKILRKTSLDELPELFNIFIGNMSIVGPRPLLPSYLPYYTDLEKHRHNVRPGLTGYAQVKGRNFISWEEIFEYDLEYINKISFFNDLKIMFLTVKKVFCHQDIADVENVKTGVDGKLYCTVNGKNYRLHQPLNIEREVHCEGNRK